MKHIIEIERFAYSIGRKRILSDVSLALPEGRITALIGPNGSGKSTLLRSLYGLSSRCGVAKGGVMRVLGLDPFRKGPAVRRAVGYVPDRLETPAWMKVSEHVRFLGALYPTWDAALAASLSERFEIDPRARVQRLSKGQRAAHAVVCALAHRPRLLLLDEPFDGLDPAARLRVFDAILERYGDEGTTVVFSTQSMAEVERLADRLVFLDEGRVIVDEDLDQVLERCAHVSVELDGALDEWTPPGRPLSKGEGASRELFYLAWDESVERALNEDGHVRDVKRLPRRLDEVFVATTERERSTCR